MLRFPYYQVNAFTRDTFGGNPAGVCLLESWPADELLQRVAAENDLSETAFLVPEGKEFRLRWMTPTAEVDLCGHATLACAYVLFHERGWAGPTAFQTRSGLLLARRRDQLIELDFPSRPGYPDANRDQLGRALGHDPITVLRSRDYVAVFNTEEEVASLKPDMELVSALNCLGVIATAPGREVDFVSRFFAPRVGVPEDPVTGSAHCTLIPYWSQQLGRTELRARQISSRGGDLFCSLAQDRVRIGGECVVYCRGELEVQP